MGNWYLESALVVICFMHIFFLVALAARDNSWADVGWGLGFVVLGFWGNWRSPHPASLFLFLLTAIWGIRLAGHLFLRKMKYKGEDWRYARWRKAWGRQALWRGYFQVFLLQGFFMWLVAIPLWMRPGGAVNHWVQWIGLVLWGLGFCWEAIADWQLARFKSRDENRGKIMRSGLWRYSRHPNYFGEILLWWGIFLIALPWGHWYFCLLSPLVITWLLSRVSGVPMLESKYRDHPGYREYVRDTPALFPFFHTLKRSKNTAHEES